MTTPDVTPLPFQREERYIVIKRKHMNAGQEFAVRSLLERIDVKTVECVVVESDWPEYETIWRMIEDRTRSTPADMPDGLVERVTIPKWLADDLLKFLDAKAAWPPQEVLIPIGSINTFRAAIAEMPAPDQLVELVRESIRPVWFATDYNHEQCVKAVSAAINHWRY